MQAYKIGFVGLSYGRHRFTFDIDEGFFHHIGDAAFEQGKVVLDLELEKTSNMLTIDFHFRGQVALVCDRCLELFTHTVDLQKSILVKFGEQYDEPSDEILIIPATESHVNIAQFVYEFLHLGMPVKRVHPEDANGVSTCDPEAIRNLEKYINKRHTDDENSPWNSLKSLKFNVL